MISPLAHISPNVKIGENVTIHPFVAIDEDVEIGDGCEIMPFVSIVRGARIGRNNRIYSGAVIGADPQDFHWERGTRTFCYIGDDNVIREQVIINRGISPEGGTRIGNHVTIMAGAHISHDTVVEGKSVIGNGVQIAGNVHIDTNVILSSNCVLHEGSKIGRWVLVKGGCRISGNVPPYVIIAHNPAVYFGINAYVMSRHGFTDDQIDEAARAYRHVYQSGTSVFNAIKRIEADIDDTPVRRSIVDFIVGVDHNIVAVPVELE